MYGVCTCVCVRASIVPLPATNGYGTILELNQVRSKVKVKLGQATAASRIHCVFHDVVLGAIWGLLDF